MIEKIAAIFKIPELKRRVLFTLGMLIIYRLGSHVPTPGVDGAALADFFSNQKNSLFGLYDMFVGGNLSQATIFALGIMPYISASIIFQVMTAVVPFFEKLQKEGESGRKKINQYTRYGTVIFSFIQGLGVAKFLEGLTSPSGVPVVPHPGIMFEITTVITLISGTMFVMWVGEQITERGIGNGISLIIFIGIVARYPSDVLNTWQALRSHAIGLPILLLVLVAMVLIIAAVILVTQAQRRIPVQYARRVVGRKVYGGQSTHIPLRVNTAGVIPIIFAQSFIMFPSTLALYWPDNEFVQTIAANLQFGTVVHSLLYSAIIVFFAYFYTAIVFNPTDLADNMKKHGGFIPGIRPGKRTAEYIDRILTHITLPGALFLAAIAILPFVLINKMALPFYFGGTGLLIVVGVALDTLQQIESHLLMRHYDGFLKKGRLRGRR
ncbi:MAG TPA: preprotein translocase subunit SecY [bacterium]|nr:preprotein translocase subunit SecY [bacterium]